MSMASLFIDSVFLAKLIGAELYGEPAAGLADAIKARVPEATEEGLSAAAERIIRQRGSGAFPKLPECLEAIKSTEIVKRGAIMPFGSTVTRYTYPDRCAEHAQRMGHPKTRPVIFAETNPDEWDAWIKYYERIGMRASVAMMMEPGMRSWTVPAKWPDEFDPSFMRPAPLVKKLNINPTQAVKENAA